MINNRVLADSQKPEDIEADEDDTGLCFISVNEPWVVDAKVVSAMQTKVNVNTLANSRNKGPNTSFPYNQSNSLKNLHKVTPTVVKPLNEMEFAKREIESGKYIAALREVKLHRSLENYFMKQLKTVDSKLHGVDFVL